MRPSWTAVAVKQHPSSATDPPTSVRAAASGASTTRSIPSVATPSTETTRPISRTIPVNTSKPYLRLVHVRLNEHVATDRARLHPGELERPRKALEHSGAIARESGGHERQDLVHEACVE